MEVVHVVYEQVDEYKKINEGHKLGYGKGKLLLPHELQVLKVD